jgi:hypothetical protein
MLQSEESTLLNTIKIQVPVIMMEIPQRIDKIIRDTDSQTHLQDHLKRTYIKSKTHLQDSMTTIMESSDMT